MEETHSHYLVFGNEKGGTGKSTLAMHVVVCLLERGHKVAVIDLDSRQRSISRYLENRANYLAANGHELPMPAFVSIPQSQQPSVRERESEEQNALLAQLERFKGQVRYIVIDCPGNDTYLSRLAHALADTLVTPMNDSFIDLDLLGEVDADNYQVQRLSHYTDMVWDSRKFRGASGKPPLDWVVTRNRLATLDSHNNQRVHAALEALQKRIMFRYVPGLYERVIYRELFPKGLTMLDLEELDELGRKQLSHVSARFEVRKLVDELNLDAPAAS